MWSWVPPLFLILHWDFIFHANWTIMEADWLSDWLNDKKTCICRVSKYLLMNIYLGRFMFGLKKDGFMIAWSFQICLWISFFNVGMEGKKRGRERGSAYSGGRGPLWKAQGVGRDLMPPVYTPERENRFFPMWQINVSCWL